MVLHPLRVVLVVLVVIAAGGCDSAPPEAPRSPPCVEPSIGSPSDFVNVAGAKIDPPKTCADRGAFIRVYGEGHRTIAMGRAAADTACHEPPPPGAPASECPVVFADAFGRAVIAKMASRGVKSGGLGLGPCGDMAGDYDAWNYSVNVAHYRDLDVAVASVKEELERWGIGHHFGISVRGPVCTDLIMREDAP